MADPIAVIIHFNGGPDDLLDRFERARQQWIQAQGGDYEHPVFYADQTRRVGVSTQRRRHLSSAIADRMKPGSHSLTRAGGSPTGGKAAADHERREPALRAG